MALSHSEAGRLGQIKSFGSRRLQYENRRNDYAESPKVCRTCGAAFAYEKRQNEFCNQSCAAKLNNRMEYSPKKKLQGSPATTKRRRPQSTPREPNFVCKNCNGPTKGRLYCCLKCSNEVRVKETNRKIEAGEKSHAPRVRAYLIAKFGNKCLNPTCGWDHSIPVCVELEHIDGNSENNTLANTTLLCPNCHSLTSTYKSRNRGHGRYTRRLRYAAGKSS